MSDSSGGTIRMKAPLNIDASAQTQSKRAGKGALGFIFMVVLLDPE